MNDRLKVVRVVDTKNWAYDFISTEHKKHSRHDIHVALYNEPVYEGRDLFYIHSPDISSSHIARMCKSCCEYGIPIIGGYGGDPKYWPEAIRKKYDYVSAVVAISPQTYKFAKENYKSDIPILFMPECVDVDFFKPTREHDTSNMIVGWAGGAHKPIKRVHILKNLRYPVIRQSEWGNFTTDLTKQERMVEFFNGIDVLLVTSLSECMPRVVLEAMACGIPIISTRVGSVPALLNDKWIVPVEPVDDVIRGINDRLDMLASDATLRHRTGIENRLRVVEHFSWQKKARLWDDVFSAIQKGDNFQATKLAENGTVLYDLLKV